MYSAIHNQTKGLYVATSSQQCVINLEISMTFISVLDGLMDTYSTSTPRQMEQSAGHMPPPQPNAHTYIVIYLVAHTQ